MSTKTKQVIVVRKDLGMRKGKMIAQGSHASMKVFFDRGSVFDAASGGGELRINLTPSMREWVEGSFAKIALSVDSEDELLDIYEQAKEAGLPCSLIQDAGRTEFHGVPTYTAVAVGPAVREDIDPITGNLKLL